MRAATRTAAALLLAAGLIACSADDEPSGEEEPTVTSVDRPSGPAADIGGPLEGGKGMFVASIADPVPTLEAAGYSQAEYTAAGTATSYATEQDPLPADGTFELHPAGEADYVTRIIVRRPTDPEAFNGTVVQEWLNVSAGADSTPEYTYLADELLREGYAWVGVSAQHVGIEGGRIAVSVANAPESAGLGKGLTANDPERYGDLSHPGDAFAYDIFTQVARSVRSPGSLDPLEGLAVEQVLAVGESQSAAALTTYVNGVQPLTEIFDGFLIHSRFAGALPLGEPDKGVDITAVFSAPPTATRTDGRAPVIVVESESDVIVLGYIRARQPDSERFRLWEVAGTAHADKFQVGEGEALLGCPDPINRGQQVFVLRAALRHLRTWASGGAAPPEADLLEVDETGTAPAPVLDDVGNTLGGVRNPVVDAPVDVLSGISTPGAPVVCILSGSTTPITDEQLAELYPSSDDYLSQYETATDAMIEAGFALEDDRQQLLDWASPERVAG